jgi:hypothetical protein
VDDDESIKPRPKRVRTTKKVQFFSLNEQGEAVPMTPLNSPWYGLYVLNPNLQMPKFRNKFRLRFRMPYECFLDLLELIKTNEIKEGVLHFRRWMSYDATGSPSSPIELLLLGALRYLGRGTPSYVHPHGDSPPVVRCICLIRSGCVISDACADTKNNQ